MPRLEKTAWEVLNATADDWEDLEQIYRLICFEFSPENYDDRKGGAYFLRPAEGAPLLEEIADQICLLCEVGLLEARLDERIWDRKDRSYVWRAWFRMTPEGRRAWESSEYMVEQD